MKWVLIVVLYVVILSLIAAWDVASAGIILFATILLGFYWLAASSPGDGYGPM
jgi:hypothetical protein